ncbi:hypothetical protein KP803_00660 [Vibrio sp. ZSDE26]|uniref:Lipoprotein n=1 Tax=Vibrio amylolyticus TaxID=2847292 RepID=A0A9X1XHF7_9VIBR|nr:hypothetical protein [Vibrio amylolyticus]MCK6261778.1 hypothetical protein [Vibrio amylolyticus]
MKYLWLVLFFMFVGCTSIQNKQHDLKQSIIGITGDGNPEYDYVYTDLNDNGVDEAIVLLKGINWCGSGGCTLLILENKVESYTLLSRSTITSAPISVTETKNHGWKDLIVRTRGKGFVLMKFDGRQYPSNPSLAPTASEDQVKLSRPVLELKLPK